MALADNIVSYWKLNNNSNDTIGGNNGSDTQIQYVTAQFLQGAQNNGTSPTISIGTTGFPSGAGARTFALWIKSITNPASGIFTELISYGSASSNNRNGIYLNNNAGTQRIGFGIFGNDLMYNHTLSTTVFSHIVCTYDGTTARVYLNGSEVTNGARSINTTVTSGILYSRSGTTTNNGTYILDEIGVWSRALSANEVSELYNGGTGNPYPFAFTVAETTTLTETITNLRARKTSVTETATLTESITAVRGKIFSVLETVSLAETLTPLRGLVASVSDAIGLTEVLVRLKKLWNEDAKSTTTWTEANKSASTWTENNKSSTTWTETDKS